VHRKAASAAGAAGKTMIGVIGRFRGDQLVFVPLSLPPMLLRRTATGTVISLQPSGASAVNPPLGSRQFGARGIRTMSTSMAKGDSIIAFTPAILDIRSPDGESLGIRRLGAAFKGSAGRKAQNIVSDIIGELKDFAGIDVLPLPLQLLVIRRR